MWWLFIFTHRLSCKQQERLKNQKLSSSNEIFIKNSWFKHLSFERIKSTRHKWQKTSRLIRIKFSKKSKKFYQIWNNGILYILWWLLKLLQFYLDGFLEEQRKTQSLIKRFKKNTTISKRKPNYQSSYNLSVKLTMESTFKTMIIWNTILISKVFFDFTFKILLMN